jgi:hypothetical protein
MAVDREAIALPLADDIATQALTGVLIMAVCAGQVKLATAAPKKRFASFKKWLCWSVNGDLHG